MSVKKGRKILLIKKLGYQRWKQMKDIDTLDSVIVKRPSYKQNLCLDKGYDMIFQIEKEITKRRYIPHIRHRGEKRFIELRYSTKRWVVERTNSFLA